VTEEQPVENRLRQGYAGQEKRSKRMYVLWGAALALLLALGLFSWLAAVPFLEVRSVLARRAGSPSPQEYVRKLGGRRQALGKLKLYLAAPRWAAPDRGPAVLLLAYCGPGAAPVLIELFAAVDDDELRSEWLETSEDAHAAMLSMGAGDKIEEAYAVLMAFGYMNAEAVPALTRALGDRRLSVRYWSTLALARIGPNARPAAEAVTRNLGDEEVIVRRASAYALGAINPPEEAVEALKQALKDPNPTVRGAAAMWLEGVPDRLAVPPLLAALKDADGRVRYIAARTLGGTRDPRALAPLVAALGDKDSSVRQAAAQALKKIRAAKEKK